MMRRAAIVFMVLAAYVVGLWRKVLYYRYRIVYCIDASFVFNGPNIQLYGNGEIVLGPSSYIGEFSTIQSASGCAVCIGSGCMIAHNVRIYSSTVVADQDFSIRPLQGRAGDVVIKDNVWIGVNVYIGPGVTIGENTVVAANSVVTKNLPAFSICAGCPAAPIKLKTFVG